MLSPCSWYGCHSAATTVTFRGRGILVFKKDKLLDSEVEKVDEVDYSTVQTQLLAQGVSTVTLSRISHLVLLNKYPHTC